MALTQPFINSIPAFDATQSNNLTLSVLGGNIITSYQFWIYLQSDSSLVYTSPTLTLARPIFLPKQLEHLIYQYQQILAPTITLTISWHKLSIPTLMTILIVRLVRSRCSFAM